MISTTRLTGHSKASNLLRHVGFAVLAAVAPIGANAGWLTFEVPLDLPDPASIGGYQGDVRFTLGRVRDEVFAESPEFLGTFETGYKGLHVVVGEMSREEAVTRTAQHVLQGTGLLASSPEMATHSLDVYIRRDRIWYLHPVPRHLRSEVFLEFVLTGKDSEQRRVLACGSAEAEARSPKDRVAEVYYSAFHDAFAKFFSSVSFLDVAGTGWASATTPTELAHIDQSILYGPSEYLVAEVLPTAYAALPKVPMERLTLRDFDLIDASLSKKKKETTAGIARRCIPELVREHLEAFYPGAFSDIDRLSSGDGQEGLIMSGEVIRYDSGGDKNRLMVDIHFWDYSSDEPLLTIRVHWIKTNANAYGLLDLAVKLTKYTADEKKMMASRIEGPNSVSWTGHYASGWMRDMLDYLAHNIAYLITASVYPDYSYPANIEVQFGSTPFRGIAALSVSNQ